MYGGSWGEAEMLQSRKEEKKKGVAASGMK